MDQIAEIRRLIARSGNSVDAAALRRIVGSDEQQVTITLRLTGPISGTNSIDSHVENALDSLARTVGSRVVQGSTNVQVTAAS